MHVFGHVIAFRQYDYRGNPDLCGIYVESDFFIFIIVWEIAFLCNKNAPRRMRTRAKQAKDSLPGRRQPVRSENKTREVF